MDPTDSDDNNEGNQKIYAWLIIAVMLIYVVFLFGMVFLCVGTIIITPFVVLWTLNGLLVLNIEYTLNNWISCATALYMLQLGFKHIKKLYGKGY